MTWPKNMVLSFVKDIEEHRVLWDTNYPSYRCGKREKAAAWEFLASKYQTTVQDVRSKWNNTQASYRRERIKLRANARRDPSQQYFSKWFAFSAMHFMTRRLKNFHEPLEKPPYQSFKSEDFDDSWVKYDNDTTNWVDMGITKEEPLSDVEPDSDLMKPEQENCPIAVAESNEEKLPEPQQAPDFRFMTTTYLSQPAHDFTFTNATNVSDESKSPIERQPPESDVADEPSAWDEYTYFAHYAAEKLRKMSSHSRAIAIRNINEILFDAETGKYDSLQR